MHVEGSELLDTHWIRLYLQFSVYKNDRTISDASILFFVLFLHIIAQTTECFMTVVSKLLLLFQEDLSKLKIVKVTIETSE